MARYRIHFLDHGDNIRGAHDVEHENDGVAIEAAHRLNVLPHMGAGLRCRPVEQLIGAPSGNDPRIRSLPILYDGP